MKCQKVNLLETCSSSIFTNPNIFFVDFNCPLSLQLQFFINRENCAQVEICLLYLFFEDISGESAYVLRQVLSIMISE